MFALVASPNPDLKEINLTDLCCLQRLLSQTNVWCCDGAGASYQFESRAILTW